jgi:hypothetical protein
MQKLQMNYNSDFASGIYSDDESKSTATKNCKVTEISLFITVQLTGQFDEA